MITVPGTGLVAEFGNYNNQALPEVSSLGWKFANFHVEIVQPNTSALGLSSVRSPESEPASRRETRAVAGLAAFGGLRPGLRGVIMQMFQFVAVRSLS